MIMNLNLQKRLAAKVAGKSPKKVILNIARFEDVKEAITKADIRLLMRDGAITVENDKGISRFRAKARAEQRKKNKQRGAGRRKGKKSTHIVPKEVWIAKVRNQRELIREIRDKMDVKTYRSLLQKVKGGFFRSRRHIKLYVEEHKLVK